MLPIIFFLTLFSQIAKPQRIVFFGDSITAGFGLSKSKAYPALIGKIINDSTLNYEVFNAGLSGETTAGGVTRIDWILKRPVSVFVLALGGNDALRGFLIKETEKNLNLILKKVKTKYPNAKLFVAGMKAPPNMGKKYTTLFNSIFKKVAKRNKAFLIPFLLEGVAGERKLNQKDAIHPNEDGQKILAQNIWSYLKKKL